MSASVTMSGVEISHTGPGPYLARSASDRSHDWPIWFVADRVGFNGIKVSGSNAKLFNKDAAIAIAAALNGAAS